MSLAPSEIEWTSADELGFADLDDDHRGLIEILNRIITAVSIENRAECKKNAYEFSPALILHFANEERFLDEIRYSHLDKHKTHHQSLLEGALAFSRLSRGPENFEMLSRHLEELKNGLLEDVRGGDHYFIKFLEGEGRDETVKSKLVSSLPN